MKTQVADFETAAKAAHLLDIDVRLILDAYNILDPEDEVRREKLKTVKSTKQLRRIFYEAQSVELKELALEALIARSKSFKQIQDLIFAAQNVKYKKGDEKFLERAMQMLEIKVEEILRDLEDREVLLSLMKDADIATHTATRFGRTAHPAIDKIMQKLVTISDQKHELLELWDLCRMRTSDSTINLVRKLIPMLSLEELEKYFGNSSFMMERRQRKTIDQIVKKTFLVKVREMLETGDVTPYDLVGEEVYERFGLMLFSYNWQAIVQMACEHVMKPRGT